MKKNSLVEESNTSPFLLACNIEKYSSNYLKNKNNNVLIISSMHYFR